jgi:hypothetical protein
MGLSVFQRDRYDGVARELAVWWTLRREGDQGRGGLPDVHARLRARAAASRCAGSSSSRRCAARTKRSSLSGARGAPASRRRAGADFPENAKNRSYDVSIYQNGYDTLDMYIRINGFLTPLMSPSYSGLVINDHLRLVDNSDSGKLVIDGAFKGSVTSSRIAGLLDGTFSSGTVNCTASNHGIAFTR